MISSYKKKPIHLIEQEINAILELWDKPFIELADDNTFVDKKWTKDLLRLLNRYNIRWFTETDVSVGYDEEVLDLLADSSCAQLLIGFEATNRNSLDHIDAINWKYKQFDQYHRVIENVQSRGVSVNGCFIFGFDSDTSDTFEVANEFISDSNLSEVQITLLTPFPGTTLYDQLKRENRLLQERFWEQCTLFDVTFEPKNMSTDELSDNFQRMMTATYSESAVNKRRQTFRTTVKNKILEGDR